MLRLFRINIIIIIITSICIQSCSDSDPVKKTSLKVRFNNAWVDNFNDLDSDGYGSFAELYFEIESNKPATFIAVIGFRYSDNSGDPSYYEYKQTQSFDLNGTDVFYTSLGAESEEITEGCYDFLIQIFNTDEPDVVMAQISAEDLNALNGICFEEASQDQLVQFELSNPLYTPIDVTINGVTQTANPGESTIFEFAGDPGVIDVFAETHGKTSSGAQIGLVMVWNFSADLSGLSYDGRELSLSSEYFFLYITNNGSVNLTPLYVNYGNETAVTVDNILLENDNVKYSTGYYQAFNNTVIAAVIQGTQNAVFWEEANQHFIPWTSNQAVSLTNTFVSSSLKIEKPAGIYPELLNRAARDNKRRLWERGMQPERVWGKPVN